MNYTQKIKTKQDLRTEQVLDHFSDRWESELKETVFDADEKPGLVKDDGIKLVTAYHGQISPTITPKYVEKEFELSFSNAAYSLKGIIDLVATIDEQDVIIDHKTAKRSMSEGDVASDLQLTCYALAYRNIFGAEENQLRFDVMVRNKTPKIQQLPTMRSQRDIDRFLKVIGYVSKAIENGIFYPTPNFMCAACGYRDRCGKW
jgi:RecB family exonuclease